MVKINPRGLMLIPDESLEVEDADEDEGEHGITIDRLEAEVIYQPED